MKHQFATLEDWIDADRGLTKTRADAVAAGDYRLANLIDVRRRQWRDVFQSEKAVQLAKLRAASPLRPVALADPVDGLALFDHARQPSLF